MTTDTTTADGQTQTKLRSRGQVVNQDPAGQLFYLTGENALLAVPAEDMHEFMEEMRLLEAVVEMQSKALETLNQYKEALMKAYHSSADATTIKKHEQQVKQAQKKVDEANKKLRKEVKPLTSFSDNTNHITELIPIQRVGSKPPVAGFKMTYVRSQKMKNHWRKYRLRSAADTTGGDNSVIKDGKIDTKKLRKQLTNAKGNTAFKFTWFDEWAKNTRHHGELIEWAEAVNKNLKYNSELVQAGDKDSVLSAKVDLNAEAQLMRWSTGCSSVSGEFNPFEKKVAIKANGHAELMLAQGKSSIDCYIPSGGYMMAYGGVDLGMLRAHMLIEASASVGASIAVELNVDADFSDKGNTVKGAPGRTEDAGLPGRSKIEMKGPDEHSQGADLSAFAGAQVEATVKGQLEWKNPEEKGKYSPFATVSQGGALRVGAGAEAGLKVYYDQGKFRFSAKASLCWGVGAKGKVQLEVDAGLIYEFVKVVAYQLKNIDYKKLEFIEDEAYKALSKILAISITLAKDIKDYLIEDLNQIDYIIDSICQSFEEENARVRLAEKITNDPDILKYTSPDTKGFLIYQLIQADFLDKADPRNKEWNPTKSISWKNGQLTSRKIAIMKIFTWVQSQAEFDNIMQRIIPTIGGSKLQIKEGKKQVQEFLDMGETNIPVISFFWTDFDGNLDKFYHGLRPKASKGSPMVRNNMNEYIAQNDVDPSFNTPCFNNTDHIEPNFYNRIA